MSIFVVYCSLFKGFVYIGMQKSGSVTARERLV